MKVKLSLAAVLLLVCSVAFGQEDKKPPMDPMMEAMMKAATPGDAHKSLDMFAGSWKTTVKSWMAPGTDPMTMEGTSETKWMMGGRYLEQRFTSAFMGMPFEGLGYTGYDNIKKQYWSTWMDNMSTAMMTSTGSYDGKTWTFKGTMPDPMTGKDSTLDEKITVTDADHHVMEMWGAGPDGKNFKMMEIAYSRKK
jgi:hypothetical protein